MARFYTPSNDLDLAQVENILRQGGIEYFLRTVDAGQQVKIEINVAEEDFPRAEDLLAKYSCH